MWDSNPSCNTPAIISAGCDSSRKEIHLRIANNMRWIKPFIHLGITSKSGIFADISLLSAASTQQIFAYKCLAFHLNGLTRVFLKAYTHLSWFGKGFIISFSSCSLNHLGVFLKSVPLMPWIPITDTVHARNDLMSHPWWVKYLINSWICCYQHVSSVVLSAQQKKQIMSYKQWELLHPTLLFHRTEVAGKLQVTYGPW